METTVAIWDDEDCVPRAGPVDIWEPTVLRRVNSAKVEFKTIYFVLEIVI